ncbi:hypothetical protein P872_18480 [Rhodonellum psychrophilum GCM71 = DSM 17998]|uniref:Phage gp6-like head-tail connector protein n=2 Tax=Rhodonellum TaxID=336827 RepID=U5BX12_9BACT|nr:MULTISPECIES: head-tail connector protein [Rhodonellum]ERM82383.1 hypothetical protein P872_18480 [Rhodonellum psychrophilum GCM71 = DSM 17998]SDZ35609.1 phage conserved hypothetical protein, phiE125 gp8 family [Rhodonellum ikkaensis]
MLAKLVKKSTETIINLNEAKEHLKILSSHEDLYINGLLDVVTASIESDLDKDLVDTHYIFQIFDKININEELHFPNTPIYKVEEVKVYEGTNIISNTAYSYSNSDEYIKFDLLPENYSRIDIKYKKGFESSIDLPTPIKQAAKIMLTDLYLYRGTIIIGKSVITLDKTVQRLLQPYKNISFF